MHPQRYPEQLCFIKFVINLYNFENRIFIIVASLQKCLAHPFRTKKRQYRPHYRSDKGFKPALMLKPGLLLKQGLLGKKVYY